MINLSRENPDYGGEPKLGVGESVLAQAVATATVVDGLAALLAKAGLETIVVDTMIAPECEWAT